MTIDSTTVNQALFLLGLIVCLGGSILLVKVLSKPPLPPAEPPPRETPEPAAQEPKLDKQLLFDVLLLLDAGKIRLRGEEVGLGPYFSADRTATDAMRRVVFTLRKHLGQSQVAVLMEQQPQPEGVISSEINRCKHHEEAARYGTRPPTKVCGWCGSPAFCVSCSYCTACGKGAPTSQEPPREVGR